MTANTPRQDFERIYRLWDEALGKRDLEASLSLYAEDASIESPLVQHLLKTREGIVRGKENLRKFITRVFETNPPQRKRFAVRSVVVTHWPSVDAIAPLPPDAGCLRASEPTCSMIDPGTVRRRCVTSFSTSGSFLPGSRPVATSAASNAFSRREMVGRAK